MDGKELLNYGILGTVLAALLGGIWRVVIWGRANVVEPIIKAHVSLIETLQTAIPEIKKIMEEQNKRLDRISDVAKEALQAAELGVKKAIETGNEVHNDLKGVQRILAQQTKAFNEGLEGQNNVIKSVAVQQADAVEAQTRLIQENNVCKYPPRMDPDPKKEQAK